MSGSGHDGSFLETFRIKNKEFDVHWGAIIGLNTGTYNVFSWLNPYLLSLIALKVSFAFSDKAIDSIEHFKPNKTDATAEVTKLEINVTQ